MLKNYVPCAFTTGSLENLGSIIILQRYHLILKCVCVYTHTYI